MLHEPVIDNQEIQRPTFLEINLHQLEKNYLAIRNWMGDKDIILILKANAYGHGLIEVARHLQKFDHVYFGVAYLEEGIMLRKAGIRCPILVMGAISNSQIQYYLHYDLMMTVPSVSKLMAINEVAKENNTQAKIHLKVDTGMERIGIHYYHADALFESLKECPNIIVDGIFSHFSTADEEDISYAQIQLERFHEVVSHAAFSHEKRPKIHMANSAGMIALPSAHFDMIRIGLLLYGVYPRPDMKKSIDVKPCMTWKTQVVYFKVVEKDQPVGYGRTWKTQDQTRIITLPVGYGDGYMRSMSNKAYVLLNGKRYPVVGSICMDQVMVDIGWDSAYNGDEAVLLGSQNNEQITVEEMAEWAGTISYEILTNINTRVPRKYLS